MRVPDSPAWWVEPLEPSAADPEATSSPTPRTVHIPWLSRLWPSDVPGERRRQITRATVILAGMLCWRLN